MNSSNVKMKKQGMAKSKEKERPKNENKVALPSEKADKAREIDDEKEDGKQKRSEKE